MEPHNYYGKGGPKNDPPCNNSSDLEIATKKHKLLEEQQILEIYGNLLEVESVTHLERFLLPFLNFYQLLHTIGSKCVVCLQEYLIEELEREAKISNQRAQPLKRYLLSEILPLIAVVLVDACTLRPSDPIDFVIKKLTQEADRKDAEIVDPYGSEVYSIQKQKIAAKGQREEKRRVEILEKACR